MRRREKQDARHRLARTVGMLVCLMIAVVFYLYFSLTWSPANTDTTVELEAPKKFALRMKKPASRGEQNVLHGDLMEARAKKRQKKQRNAEKGIVEEEEKGIVEEENPEQTQRPELSSDMEKQVHALMNNLIERNHKPRLDVKERMNKLEAEHLAKGSTRLKPASAERTSSYVEFTVVISKKVEDVERYKIVLEVIPQWAPLGAKRFIELVNSHYFENARFFRVIKKFMAQFGIAGDPEVTKQWRGKNIIDDPVLTPNVRGTITFATSGKNSRSNQLFINFVNNGFLDKQGFSPIGKVVEGMNAVDKLYDGYGEGGVGDGSDGKGPSQGQLSNQGNAYLETYFPKLSYIESARVIPDTELYIPPPAWMET